jgi:hypothetical protein
MSKGKSPIRFNRNNLSIIELKDGTEELSMVIISTINELKAINKYSPLAFYEFIILCRNPEYKITHQPYLYLLKEMHLISHNGKIHNSIRNIANNAISGKGESMKIGMPFD